ncbi:MAG: DUF6537 domain-containing protein [Bradyrhizobium sp.]|uniref:DUF6537 domain-containing protein n=4 Tax=Bradyrhizobium TaxID=374 RepID=A0ABS5G942_9BRAD|nr:MULTISPECIES: DUF6537 domain-containing protein [Bradyrhizobium]RTM02686.1 MAG: hypothetical protein EKK32_10395 [Bradyrhizobiaceae bacterium]ABQ38991.1 hypothetical protein BBta_7108 [Bradyrhizobium sp. BTAi1]MBR1137680.1 hypothetical protein [Bradyrhizobium denitrificans]MCL8482283.1 hypothetical protein [Bradyrhizobium denitrificans]MDU1494932.1 DUF6537 domain-containing protein [Bradyrhizobium sp.]
MESVRSSLRYLFADIIGDADGEPPFLPAGLPDAAAAAVSDGIHLLMDYQGARYAQLYVDRLQRFVRRSNVDAAALCRIAQLLAARMAYEDPIRIAQLRLAELEAGRAIRGRDGDDLRRFRLDELIGVLPQALADSLLTGFEQIGWLGRRRLKVRFSTRSRLAVRRLRMMAGLRRWRLQSVRYAEERVWAERWLHMIARALDKQPAAASAVIETATMIQGQGDGYRQGLADWHAIIDGLVKPTFDGVLPISDLAAAIAEARAAAMPDPRQAALKRAIAQIRVQALSVEANSHAAE